MGKEQVGVADILQVFPAVWGIFSSAMCAFVDKYVAGTWQPKNAQSILLQPQGQMEKALET